jgi:putative endonuclease
MLECSDGSIYTGYTTDPARRLAEHNAGRAARYTRARRPVRLVFLEQLKSRSRALSREARVKRLDRKRKLLLCLDYERREKQGSR